MPKPLFYLLLVCILSQHATAQTVDTSFHKDALNAVNIYYQSLGASSPLYNGSEYLEYGYTLQEGNPFFQSDAWTNGSIVLDGMNFHEVPMLYDIVKDQVIIQDFQKAYKINLPADRIQQFKLSGHTFIRIIQSSDASVKTGFYDQLYNGKIAVYVRREKKIIEKYGGLQLTNVIEQKNIYYIKKDNTYYTIKNKRALLDALKDKKKAIQQYLKKIKVKFKDDPARVMTLVAEYYDKSTN